MARNIDDSTLETLVQNYAHLTHAQFAGHLQGSLAPDVQSRVDAHIKICPHCRADVQMVKEVIAECGSPDVHLDHKPTAPIQQVPYPLPSLALRAKPVHRLAASTTTRLQPLPASTVVIGTLVVEDQTFSFVQSRTEEGTAYVIVSGPIPPGACHLRIGQEIFALDETTIFAGKLVVGLRPLHAERLLSYHEQDAHQYPFVFEP